MAKKVARRGHKIKQKTASTIVNRRASFDYELGDSLVVGLELTGKETKAARLGHVQLRGAYVTPRQTGRAGKTELYLINASFSLATNEPKASGQSQTTVDTRARRILAKRQEINQLAEARQFGKTIIPTKILISGRYVKLVIALGKGKRAYDKRETIRRREADREAMGQIVRN